MLAFGITGGLGNRYIYIAQSNLKNEGIIDSAVIVEEALKIAYSYSKMFLESSSWLEKKTEGNAS
jgi:hypothetical protein